MIHKNLNFIIEGSGEECVLYLHGWGGNRHSLDILKNATSYTNMSLDFFSSNENFDEWYDTYESTLDVYLELKERGIHTLSIVAHSYGCRVAVILASVFDIKIKNMILVSSAGINIFDIKKHIKILNYKFVKMCVKLRIYGEYILDKYGSSDYKVLSKKFKAIFRNIVRQDLAYIAHKVQVKNAVILVYGNMDKVTPLGIMKRYNKCIKNSVCKVIDGGEHFCYITHSKLVKDIINNNIK